VGGRKRRKQNEGRKRRNKTFKKGDAK